MTIFLTEMLELPNFGHMTTSKIYFESPDKILFIRHGQKYMTSSPLFQNNSVLRRPRVDSFADITKISTMFFETTFKDSKKQNYKLCI